MSLLSSAVKALYASHAAYVEAQAYWSGEVKERFASRRLADILRETGVRYRINFSATPVDAVVERLEIAGFTGEPAALAKWDEVWADNDMPLEAKGIIHALTERLGDSYVIGWPDEEMDSGMALYAHEPTDVRVFYDPERPRRKSHAIHRYVAYARPVEDQDPDLRKLEPGRLYSFVTIYFRDHVERWVTLDPIDNGLDGDRVAITHDTEFVRFADDEDNPWDLIPVWHFRTGRPYGRPQHRDAYTVQDMINSTLANLMNSMNHAGYPQRFALSEAAQGQPDGAGFYAPGEDASTIGTTVSAGSTGIKATNPGGFQAGPGETWLMKGAKEVGQFETADSANFVNPITSLVKWMGLVTDTPVHLFDMGGQIPSGESLKAAMAPLHAKVYDQQAQLGATYREMADDVLTMLGVAHQNGAVQVMWMPIDVIDNKETWEVVQAKVAAGVPKREALIQAGYLPTIVDTWLGTPAVAPVLQLTDGGDGNATDQNRSATDVA